MNDFLKKALPWLGTALGGPLGGIAVSAIGGALGISDATEATIKTALSGATPEQLAALKKADQDFAVQMQALGFKNITDLETIAAGDRANARDREIKTGDAWTPRLLAAIIVVGYFLVQWFVLSHVVPVEMRDIVLRSMGTLDMALGLVLGYYFGSSANSHAKDSTIANMQK